MTFHSNEGETFELAGERNTNKGRDKIQVTADEWLRIQLVVKKQVKSFKSKIKGRDIGVLIFIA